MQILASHFTAFIQRKYDVFDELHIMVDRYDNPKLVSEYDQEIPQSQTADNPVAPRGRAAQPSQDIRKTN